MHDESTIEQHAQVHSPMCTSGQTVGIRVTTRTVQSTVNRIGKMREYRLYIFEAGRLISPTEFHAVDDSGAIEIGNQKWVEGRQMELWEHGRKVWVWGFPERHSCGVH